jgi:hypothetical protein
MQNPNDVKSQDDTRAKQDVRSTEVLIHTIEKCERLQKQLDIAIDGLNIYAEEKCIGAEARQALEQIKELNNDKAS